jgi:hypothetical protein
MAATLLSGLAFGAALTASGVYHPSAIIGQLKLDDWHMLETFLMATASSTLVTFVFCKVLVLLAWPSPHTVLVKRGPFS